MKGAGNRLLVSTLLVIVLVLENFYISIVSSTSTSTKYLGLWAKPTFVLKFCNLY